jgi:hypothetical protein
MLYRERTFFYGVGDCTKNGIIYIYITAIGLTPGGSSTVHSKHHVTRHDTPIHNILSTAQLSISQKALGTLPEDGNVMSKRVGATIHK